MVMVMVVVQATLGILYLPVFSHGDWHPKSWGTYIKLVAAAAAAAAGVNLLAIKVGCGSGRAGVQVQSETCAPPSSPSSTPSWAFRRNRCQLQRG
jgi:hypothetical protein